MEELDPQTFPMLLAEEIAEVQPMTDAGRIFAHAFRILEKTPPMRFGQMLHNFVYGWMAFDGKELIPLDIFFKKYPDINYDELANLTNQIRWSAWKPK